MVAKITAVSEPTENKAHSFSEGTGITVTIEPGYALLYAQNKSSQLRMLTMLLSEVCFGTVELSESYVAVLQCIANECSCAVDQLFDIVANDSKMKARLSMAVAP